MPCCENTGIPASARSAALAFVLSRRFDAVSVGVVGRSSVAAPAVDRSTIPTEATSFVLRRRASISRAKGSKRDQRPSAAAGRERRPDAENFVRGALDFTRVDDPDFF
jgi:hypothetical protein